MTASEAPREATFKDRKVGLVLFGIVQLLVAVAFLGMGFLQVVMGVTTGAMAAEGIGSPGLFAASGLVYALLAAGTAWLGIGSILCRRWARALTLVLAWMALIVGVLSTAFMVSIVPSMAAEMRSQGGPETQTAAAFALGCMFLVLAVVYILVPAAFVLFYRSPHVKATCEHHDPQPRWTDRLPPPVLAGGLLLLTTILTVVTPLMGMPMPFFGRALTGAPAWIYAVVVAGLAAVLLRGFLRLERWAWLGTLLLMTLNGASAYLTFRGDGLTRAYEAMNVSPEQIEEMATIGIMTNVPWLMLVSVLLMLAFYLWLGKYFDGRSDRRRDPLGFAGP